MGLGNTPIPSLWAGKGAQARTFCIKHMSWLLMRNDSVRTLISLTCCSCPWLAHHFPIHGGRCSRWLGCPGAAVLRVVTVKKLTHPAVICPRLARDRCRRDGKVTKDNSVDKPQGCRSVLAGGYCRSCQIRSLGCEIRKDNELDLGAQRTPIIGRGDDIWGDWKDKMKIA